MKIGCEFCELLIAVNKELVQCFDKLTNVHIQVGTHASEMLFHGYESTKT